VPKEAIAVLRARNQLTIPDRLVKALGAKAGDQIALTFDEAQPGHVELRVMPTSYAGIAGGLYGRTAEERAAYIAEERGSWNGDEDPGRASDGTPYLTFDESRRTYRQTEVTRERYEREPKLRWPKCDVCGRSVANMTEHRRKHAVGRLSDRGIRTDPEHVGRSRAGVRKRRASGGERSSAPRR